MIQRCCEKWGFIFFFFLLFTSPLFGEEVSFFQNDQLQTYIRIVIFFAMITLIPLAVIMMTSFTRLTIIFHFLRQAMGSAQVPSNQIIMGLALILTAFIMHPVIEEIYDKAISPYTMNQFSILPEVESGKKSQEVILIEKAWTPLREFLLSHTRESDLALFMEISEKEPEVSNIPWYCIIPSFLISELKTAFILGFLLFLPFLVIDLVVTSVLMSLGMAMLPPMMISIPFKLLLFILLDGWHLIVQQLILGFQNL